MDFHEKHFHRTELITYNHKDVNDNEDRIKQFFCCQEEGCFSKSGKRKVFKSYPAFKQHYMLVHATKMHECTKCGRKFSDMSKLKQHKSNCGLKLECSCGIAYYGKRGLLAHIKLTSHKLPDSVKHHFTQTPRIRRPASNATPNPTKKLGGTPGIRTLMSGNRKPIPILPKGHVQPRTVCITSSFPATSQTQPVIVTNTVNSTCNPPMPNAKSMTPVNLLRKRRYVIDVLMPQENLADFKQPHQRPIIPSLQASKIDSLSTAMLTSGIQSCVLRQSNGSENGVCNDKSHTEEPVGVQQPAQDFSCQTEKFLSWLDEESSKCNHTLGNSTVNICTQTLQSLDPLQSDIDFHAPDLTQSRNVAQIETQTDDDWINALFQEDTPLATRGQSVILTEQNPSDCSDSSTFHSVLPEMSCDIQTQTNFIESIAHVTTQTSDGICVNHNGTDFTDPVLNYIVSDSQTQTDSCYDVSVDTAHTQTSFGCDDIVHFLNIQTQTDLYNQQDQETVP